MRRARSLTETQRTQLETVRTAWRRRRLAGGPPDAPLRAVPEGAQRNALVALCWALVRLRHERPVLLFAGSLALALCLAQALWGLIAAVLMGQL